MVSPWGQDLDGAGEQAVVVIEHEEGLAANRRHPRLERSRLPRVRDVPDGAHTQSVVGQNRGRFVRRPVVDDDHLDRPTLGQRRVDGLAQPARAVEGADEDTDEWAVASLRGRAGLEDGGAGLPESVGVGGRLAPFEQGRGYGEALLGAAGLEASRVHEAASVGFAGS